MMADSVNALLKLPPSSALLERIQIDDGPPEVVFILREELRLIKKLGAEPEIEFLPGVIAEYQVLLVPLFIRLGPLNRDSIFLTWIDAYEPAGTDMENLRLLSIQPRIHVQLYDDRPEPELSLSLPNAHQVFLAGALTDIKAAPPWTVNQYETARVLLYQRRQTNIDIWWSI